MGVQLGLWAFESRIGSDLLEGAQGSLDMQRSWGKKELGPLEACMAGSEQGHGHRCGQEPDHRALRD